MPDSFRLAIAFRLTNEMITLSALLLPRPCANSWLAVTSSHPQLAQTPKEKLP
ncbi:MAG: hypothetical protein ABI417_07420 [Coleofasciculaceae cyanobacterium]